MATKAQILSWYGVLRDFAGPFATILAASAAFYLGRKLGMNQARTAEAQTAISLDKLKYDLFQKRYEIYSAARLLIEKTLHVRSLNQSNPDEIRSLYVKIDEARFFFPSDVQAHLERVSSTAEKLLRHVGLREVQKLSDEEWAKAADQIGGVALELQGLYEGLPKAFEKSLSFQQVTRD